MLVEVIQAHMPRSRVICDAMCRGIKACGDETKLIMEDAYQAPVADVAVFYGLYGLLTDAFVGYKRNGRKAVYIDLGYWKRTEGGKLYGYHKVSVNSRHPTAYFQNRPKNSGRFKRLEVPILPWRKGGRHILVAGMGPKAAACEGFKVHEWEEAAIAEIKRYTDRPILYRPKPSWRHAIPIEGAVYNPPETPLDDALDGCHAVITHHSNVAVDAILAGIPAFCWHGVAQPLSLQDLSLIETPLYPEDRGQWAYDIAYTQWRPDEMATGETWRYLKDEGLVP